MRRIWSIILFTLFLHSGITLAQWSRRPGTDITNANSHLGIGFAVGSPTGFSWKYWLSRNTALDGAIGWGYPDAFRVHVDYLVHAFPFQSQSLSVYYGGGAAIGGYWPGAPRYLGDGRWVIRDDQLGFGVRGALGMAAAIPQTPIEAFVETGPILVIAPSPAGFLLDFALGARVYF